MMNYHVNHFLISYNKFTNNDGAYGREGVINHESSNILVEKNDISHTQRAAEEPGLATKTDGGSASDIIFRFNDIHDTIGNGITVINEASNVYIYGNLLSNNEPQRWQ